MARRDTGKCLVCVSPFATFLPEITDPEGGCRGRLRNLRFSPRCSFLSITVVPFSHTNPFFPLSMFCSRRRSKNPLLKILANDFLLRPSSLLPRTSVFQAYHIPRLDTQHSLIEFLPFKIVDSFPCCHPPFWFFLSEQRTWRLRCVQLINL